LKWTLDKLLPSKISLLDADLSKNLLSEEQKELLVKNLKEAIERYSWEK
jgi:hypothetical protein